ncbi:hypothetical protein KGP36_02765 [Patescibacteria group bacterium]|nr:hypothetical protein [Patescibacteria group bacterium]
MTTKTVEEMHEAFKAQGVPREHLAFVCPMCGTVQSCQSLIKAGAGATVEEVEKFIGFSCVGRWTKAGPPPGRPKENNTKGCNWTLGGLFQCHKLEVITPDGKRQPSFEVATPDQARELRERNK